ncbi:MAG: rhomboid family intramembrane serine protease [Bacteroidia bacterium]
MKNFLGKQLLKISLFPLCFLLIAWGVFYFDTAYGLDLSRFGTEPRTGHGLSGILVSPFLHGGLDHILSNSLPLLILGMLTFYFYKPIAWPVFIWIYMISGIWLWIGGRGGSVHIGASGLIYGAATFLFFSGVFRKHKQLMVVSALVLFLYGSMMWGIFPLMPGISWEAHLFGSVAGIMVAYSYRNEGPQRKVYEWENETDDEPTDFSEAEQFSEEENQKPPDQTIVYHFVPKKKEEE